MKRKRLLLLIPPLAFLAILGIRLLLNQNQEQEEVRTTEVVTASPRHGLVEEIIQYPGTLRPSGTVTVLPKAAGKIESILVTEGDQVAADQPIALLERDSLALQVEQAKASFQAAEAQYEQALRGMRDEEIENTRALVIQAEKELATARKNLERANQLYKVGAIPETELESAENGVSAGETRLENAKRSLKLMEEGSSDEELKAARSNMEAARARYELARLQYDNGVVKAPASGLVADIFVDEGNTAGPASTLAAIVQDDVIIAEVELPEKYYGRMHTLGVGSTARVYPIAYPDDGFFTGEVTAVSSLIDPESRTFTLEITVDNSEGRLRPGMYVNVDLVLERIENALLVPESSLTFRDDRYVVFAAAGSAESGDPVLDPDLDPAENNAVNNTVNKAVMKPVSVGLRKDGNAQILQGISPDDEIIIEGNAFLEDGQHITVIEG
jgi:multidrug efflux pump subunit AcrA (membrane-fusion protein)